MRNMLNQFYKYMASKLIGFLQEQGIKGGERYFLQFDQEENVREFYSTLKSLPESSEFIYKHEQGSAYETFGIGIEDVKVVVAATIEEVTPDFLVTIRNQVSEQEGPWDRTALISISHLSLDSIQGGSKDLQQKGMPFNIKSITNYIKEELSYNGALSTSEKELIKFHLDKKLEDLVVQTSIWDYADIIALINKGRIDESDFKALSLFPDRELGKDSYLKPSEINARLIENNRLYELVERIHDYETLDTELEKHFEEKMIPKLKRENWFENEFPQVREGYGLKNRALGYISSETKKLNKKLTFWERPHSETKVGNRKRHIFIFNPDILASVSMTFEFDDNLKKQFIHKKSERYATVSGRKLKVELPSSKDDINFYQIKYKHNAESQSNYEFNFCVAPFPAEQLDGIESLFEIKKAATDPCISLKYRGENTTIGKGFEGVEFAIREAYETIKKVDNQTLTIDIEPGAWEDDSLPFTLQINNAYLPFEFKDTDTKSIPISPSRVWKLKRERQENFYIENDRLIQGTATYYPYEDFKEMLHIEKEWIENNTFYLTDRENHSDISLPGDLENAYLSYLNYFKKNNLLPSLTYFDGELRQLSMEYLKAVKEAIESIEEHSLLTKEQKNLFLLGMKVEKGKVWLSPLHPLNVAYQFKLDEELKDEELHNTILERLHPQNLLPFLYSEGDELYRPSMELRFSEWHEYEPESQITVGTANEFLEIVVEEKIKQFIHHFDYLFLESARSPLLLNVVQIHNDKEVVRGIYSFLKKQLENNGPDRMLPIEVALYRDGVQSPSAFELFSTLQTPSEIEAEFNISLKSKDFDSFDVLRLIREHIHYFKIELSPSTEFQYAHISFFKLPTQDIDASHQVDKMETGIALDGLLSSVVSIASDYDYRSGYGLNNAPKQSNHLIELATSYNELSFNMKNEGKNSYSKNKSIVMSTSTDGKAMLERLYKSSAWVTFIDPGVDLDFFQKSTPDLLVIHYNDQHTSSDRYDAITVTDKANQYKQVIKDYVEEKVDITEGNIDIAIKSFNSINGEWLLRIIGSKGHFAREKISIVSAMKYLESFLQHTNITWIPVSLEEILRIASAVKLTKADGIFSAKNLNSNGKHSDDILMMGLEEIENELYLHIYPVEVKIGRLQTSKASIQIDKTTELFKEYLIDKPGEASFKKKFFRNFFAQILLSNAKKLHSNDLWTEEKYQSIHDLKPKLMNDSFSIGTHLESFIGKGAVLTFRKDYGFRSAERVGNHLKLTFIEEDAYAGLAKDIGQILDKMQKGYMDFNPEKMLFTQYHPQDASILIEQQKQDEGKVNVYSHGEGTDEISVNQHDEKRTVKEVSPVPKEIEEKVTDKCQVEEPQRNVYPSEDSTTSDESETVLPNSTDTSDIGNEKTFELETDETTIVPKQVLGDIKVLIGTVAGSNHLIHWEFGHSALANRHLFITGRSGQGKTYFIQCLLWELSKSGISNIIIDYTDGFKKSQLETNFKEKMGDQLEQFIVLAKKFPVNPFKRNQKMLDEDIILKEDDSDVAERLKNVISSIYPTLGIQQLNSIYQAVMKGMSIYDEKMNLPLLRELLEEDGSGPAKTAVSQMNLLIDKNPFDYDKNLDWSFLEKEKGKVFVIQLTGYSPDVQKMITEFILWDLWYYKLQHGRKDLPFPVVLDESQRLDFSSDSPSAKILVEGRKFGWSGWFATQFLKGGFTTDQVSRLQNASMKVFFAPMETEVSSIAASITQDNAERKEWEVKLANLKKGQCIIYGPILDKKGNLLPSKPYLVEITPLEHR